MTSLDPVLATRLADAVERMAAFPGSAERILALAQDVDCSPRDLVQAIEKDPVVTFKVLRVVNSHYGGAAKRVNSVDHAVVFLGINTVKNLALSSAATGMLPSNLVAGFEGRRYLLHSLVTAGVARQLAQRLPEADPRDFFIAALLHDFGKIVLAQYMPEEFRQAQEHSLWRSVPIHQSLIEALGLDHATVASALARKWCFGDHLVETLHFQHAPEQCDTDVTAAVFAANQISKRMGFDFGGSLVVQPLPAVVARRLGGTLEEVIASLGDMRGMLQEAAQSASL